MSEEREQELKRVLGELSDAVYTAICESNGISDNEWRLPGEKPAIPEFPVASFVRAMKRLEEVWSASEDVLDPINAAKQKKWRDACATASAIMERFKEDEAATSPNRARSSLSRNIADAINGSLIVTMEEREGGKKLGGTMDDKLAELVAAGKLVEVKP